jgi:hypothetical protein
MKRTAVGVFLAIGIFVGLSVVAKRFLEAFTPQMLPIAIVLTIIVLWISERRHGARPSLYSIVAHSSACAVVFWIVVVLDVRWYQKALLAFVVATPVMLLANAGFRSDLRRAQTARNMTAARIVDQVMAGDPDVGPFALYLRPFETTEKLSSGSNPRGGFRDVTGMRIPIHLDLETLLDRALRGDCPLIALGRRGEMQESAGRATVTDERWQTVVQALAKRATLLVMVPLARPSTLWELDWLFKQRMLGKVLFVMPETPYEVPLGVVHPVESGSRGLYKVGFREYDPEQHTLNLAGEWQRAMRQTRDMGLTLPSLAAVGALFTLDSETGRVARIVPLGLAGSFRRDDYLRTALAYLDLYPSDHPRPSDIADAIAASVVHAGPTLEFALIRAADGYLVWGDDTQVVNTLRRAVLANQLKPSVVEYWFNSLPELVRERLDMGDVAVATRYVEGAKLFLADPQLAPYMNPAHPSALHDLVQARLQASAHDGLVPQKAPANGAGAEVVRGNERTPES